MLYTFLTYSGKNQVWMRKLTTNILYIQKIETPNLQHWQNLHGNPIFFDDPVNPSKDRININLPVLILSLHFYSFPSEDNGA